MKAPTAGTLSFDLLPLEVAKNKDAPPVQAPLIRRGSGPVYAMARVPCHCRQCGGARVWKITYKRGEPPEFENDFGERHDFVAGE